MYIRRRPSFPYHRNSFHLLDIYLAKRKMYGYKANKTPELAGALYVVAKISISCGLSDRDRAM